MDCKTFDIGKTVAIYSKWTLYMDQVYDGITLIMWMQVSVSHLIDKCSDFCCELIIFVTFQLCNFDTSTMHICGIMARLLCSIFLV